MKLSLNWLKRYIDHGFSAEDLAFRLTMAGLEVEHTETFGLDTVFEIEITPNRPDLLNMLGLAREVSAIADKPFVAPEINDYDEVGNVEVQIENPVDCGRYIATLIDGVSVKALPAEYSVLLQAFGQKPIVNIVDITNFVMFELGQPLHAFDYDKLAGGKIVVRRARKGEKIVTLDNVERVLDESILVIADAEKPVAIAGIMGGLETSVSSSTKRVLLEAASFDLGLIRRASRKLGLTSDSCYRFERGVAWKFVEAGANRATDLIGQLAGGAVTARRDYTAKTPDVRTQEVTVTGADIESLLGAPIPLERAGRILKRLGCVVAPAEQQLTVIPPHFRHDIRIKQDVIEEVARIVGYDNLPMSLPHVPAENIPVDFEQDSFNDRLRGLLIAEGCNEVVTYALTSAVALEKTGYDGPVIKLQNAMSAEQELMRPTALPNLLGVVSFNMNHGQKDLKLFEVGKKYLPGAEKWILSLVMTGRKDGDWRRTKKDALDFYDIKGALESVLSKLRVAGLQFVAAPAKPLVTGQSAAVQIGGQNVGFVGKLRSDVLSRFDIKKAEIYFAEVELDAVEKAVRSREKFVPIIELPAAVRDISLAVKDVNLDQLKAVCVENGGELLKKIDFLELYCGDKIETGYKGYVLSLTYQAAERTLTDEEVNQLHESIVQKLIATYDLKRR